MYRIVIKVGSSTITDKNGISKDRLFSLVEFIVQLRDKYEVIIVTSGAVATGYSIAPTISNTTTAGKQALAAIGQAELINTYKKKFEKCGVHVAQILLTSDDFDSFKRSENAKTAVNTLLSNGIIPIINENDSVVVDEILRGDNDQLSAQVTYYFDASMLIILSDIDGYYDRDPNKYHDANMVKIVDEISPDLLEQSCNPNFAFATGGIVTKLKAADFLIKNNKKMFLSSGFHLKAIKDFLIDNIHSEGTLFIPKESI